MLKTDYLIIGSSAAGCNCVEGICSIDKKSSITMISADDKIFYSRPVIAEYLTNELNTEEIKYRDNSFIKKNKIKFIPKTTAEKIDTKKKILFTSNDKIEFKKLFIGIGGEPIVPPELQTENKNIFTFTSLNEISRLKNITDKYETITVVGAGFIGLEVAFSLRKLNKKVNLIELAPRVLERQSDEFLSNYIELKLLKNNIDIHTKTSIKKIKYDVDENITEIILTNGKKLPSSSIVCCIGVKPSINLAKNSGIKCNRGISVNQYLETNKKDIFAGGDVIETKDISTGNIMPIPLWFAAAEQGIITGKNIAGEKFAYEGTIPMSPLKFLDIPGLSTGDVTKENDETILYKTERPEEIYKKYFIEKSFLKGYILLNDLSNAGILTKIIKNQIPLTDKIKEKLTKDEFSLADLPDEIIRADYEF
jgi:NAD(P)H-nitrite reductase large subunit